MANSQAERNWDEVYSSGTKYQAEPPVEFVDTIIKLIKQHNLMDSRGLYIGCGNGRNYIPLTNAGLDIVGLDISQVALDQLSAKNPALSEKLIHSDFLNFDSQVLFSYIISIQVFQHGTWKDIQKLFSKVNELLIPGGLFFLRVRSINTGIKNVYRMVEQTPHGGFTVHFEKGSKKDLDIHFFSPEELNFLSQENFKPIGVQKEVISTSQGKTSLHLEAVWMKL